MKCLDGTQYVKYIFSYLVFAWIFYTRTDHAKDIILCK